MRTSVWFPPPHHRRRPKLSNLKSAKAQERFNNNGTKLSVSFALLTGGSSSLAKNSGLEFGRCLPKGKPIWNRKVLICDFSPKEAPCHAPLGVSPVDRKKKPFAPQEKRTPKLTTICKQTSCNYHGLPHFLHFLFDIFSIF